MITVKQARLHQAIHVPGVFEISKVLNGLHNGGIKMVLHPAGLLCEFKTATFIIPLVNIQALVLEGSFEDVQKA